MHDLSSYNLKEVRVDSLNIILLGLFAIFVGYFIPSLFDLEFDANRSKKLTIGVNEQLLIRITLGLCVFSVIGGIMVIHVISSKIGGFEMYLTRPIVVRQEIIKIQLGESEVTFLYRLGNYLLNIGFVSSILGGILLSLDSRKKLIGLVPLLAILVPQIAVMGRYAFVNALIFLFSSYVLFSYFSKKNKILEFTIYSILSVAIVGTLSYYILKFRTPLADDIFELLSETLYLYLSGGITAFDQFLYSDFQLTYGQSSFRTIFKWLARIGFVSPDEVFPVHNKFIKVSPSFNMNTYTFARSIYQDFGFYGYLFITTFWGFLTRYFTMKVYNNFSLVNLLISCMFIFSLFISFFSFYFQNITRLVFLIMVIALLIFLLVKNYSIL